MKNYIYYTLIFLTFFIICAPHYNENNFDLYINENIENVTEKLINDNKNIVFEFDLITVNQEFKLIKITSNIESLNIFQNTNSLNFIWQPPEYIL